MTRKLIRDLLWKYQIKKSAVKPGLDDITGIAREILPPILLRTIYGLFYGWHGNYKSWEAANRKCSGYDARQILEKVEAAALKVKEGVYPYERDSVNFDKIQYSFPLLAGLMWIAARNDGKINVLDFGGSLGSSYYQNIRFLNSLKEFHWCIVEQNAFVKVGKEKFADDVLHFYYSVAECMDNTDIDVVLFSSVLQYLESPYAVLEEVFSRNPRYIIIDRTFFTEKKGDRITIQKVPGWIYKAKYSCWFFSEKKFLDHFTSRYDLVMEFMVPEYSNIRSVSKGFLFQRKG